MGKLARANSFKRATNMITRTIGLTMSGRDDVSESSMSITTESGTLISALTEEIPDMRDDSVQQRRPLPQPRIKPPLPPKARQSPHMEKNTKEGETQQVLPAVTAKEAEISSPVTASEQPSAAPPSVKVTKGVEFIKAKLDPLPRLLLEDVLNSNIKVVEDAVDRLARRCRQSETIRMEAFRMGAHAVLVMAMRKHRDNAQVQASGCRCITNMTCQFPLAKKTFSVIGGVETAVVAMRSFPESQQVQAFGCSALMNIMCGHMEEAAHIALTIANRFVNELDGIVLVVKAMTKFPEDGKIQLGGCGLFQNLAKNKSFIYSMLQGGAVGAVGASLTSHPNDPNIKSAAGSFMKKVFA